MKGFTLVETFIVISITLLLSALAFTYNRSSERQIALFKEQAVIVGLLNRAKSLAIQKYQNPATPQFLTCAFGLHFEANSPNYILFQDLGQGSCGPDVSNYRYDSTSNPPEALETFSLDPKVEFVNLASDLDILFVPPELNIISTQQLPVKVTLGTKDKMSTVSITVAEGGQITIE